MKTTARHEPRIPLTLRGGIRAQSGRGLHGRPWWSRRWLDMIEGFRLGARLGRGRGYALAGQVARLEVAPGCVAASVQGSSAAPYRSELRLRCLDEAGRRAVLALLRAHPMLAARLLVRDLPRELEAVFRQAGCPLFPERAHDIETSCTCPDGVNPCKHLAAVYFLLGEALDRDPLLLLALRGILRQNLLGGEPAAEAASTPQPPASSLQPTASSPQPAAFWGVGLPPFENYGLAPRNEFAAPLVRRLGPLPFWRGQERFMDAMEAVCTRAAPLGWRVWAGEVKTFRRAEPPPAPAGAGRPRRQRLQMDVLNM